MSENENEEVVKRASITTSQESTSTSRYGSNEGGGSYSSRDAGERKGYGEGSSYERRGGGYSQSPRKYKKKVLDTRNLNISYRDVEILERFVSKTGKILPRRVTGANARIQRQLAREIKCSRMISLLPFSRP